MARNLSYSKLLKIFEFFFNFLVFGFHSKTWALLIMFQTYVDFYSKTVNLNFFEQAFLELGSIKIFKLLLKFFSCQNVCP